MFFPSYQNLEGYCCPETLWCPIGTPLVTKNCKNPMSEEERCPPETHHCFTGTRGTACCPLPCPSIIGMPAVIVNGQCYPQRQLDETCDFDQQCPTNAKCNGKSQKCQCPTGYAIQYSQPRTICRKICQGKVLGSGGLQKTLLFSLGGKLIAIVDG